MIETLWPLDQLASGEVFEAFCADYLHLAFPDHKVYRYGKSGHSQRGRDIEVIYPNGVLNTYQCKREQKFNETSFKKAVEEHKQPANRKCLLLAKVASPELRDEVKLHHGWELWDQVDISRRLRLEISRYDQRELAEQYFPGREVEVSGLPNPTVWQSGTSFFKALLNPERSFSHHWTLTGRQVELDELLDWSDTGKKPVMILTGNAGTGKSRLLLEWSQQAKTSARRLFLTSSSLSAIQAKDLPTGPKILVCDDAHGRADLRYLLEYAADQANQTRLLLVARTHGLPLIEQMATQFESTEIHETQVMPLTKQSREQLATQTLQQYGGPAQLAESLAKRTKDCPLFTVLGGKMLSERGTDHPYRLLSDEAFSKELLRRLYEPAMESSSEQEQRLLMVLALLQPVRLDQAHFWEEFCGVADSNQVEDKKLLDSLEDKGLIVKRASQVRIIPDLLADYILRKAYFSNDGQSTGEIERHWKELRPKTRSQVLYNISLLNWQLKGKLDSLLRDLWGSLGPSDIETAIESAYFQPEHGLRFVEKNWNNPSLRDQLHLLLERVTYHPEHLQRVCLLLWESGRNDKRPEGIVHQHPVRILKQLSKPQPKRSTSTISQVLDFGLGLLSQPSSWACNHSPLSFLSLVFTVDGHDLSSDGRTITTTRYVVHCESLAPQRLRLLEACLKLLTSSSAKVVNEATQAISSSLREPVRQADLFQRKAWKKHISFLLGRIRVFIAEIKIPELSQVLLAQQLQHGACYGSRTLKGEFKKILKSCLPTLRHRTLLALRVGTWDYSETVLAITKGRRPKDEQQPFRQLKREILDSYASVPHLKDFLCDCLVSLSQIATMAHGLIADLLWEAPIELCELWLSAARTGPNTVEFPQAYLALARLCKESPQRGLELLQDMFVANERLLIAKAYNSGVLNSISQYELDILRQLAESRDPELLKATAGALQSTLRSEPATAVEIYLKMDLTVSEEVNKDIAMWIVDLRPTWTLSQAGRLLDKFLSLPALSEGRLNSLIRHLYSRFPDLVVNFFKQRLERELLTNLETTYEASPDWLHQGGLNIQQHTMDWKRRLFELLKWISEFESRALLTPNVLIPRFSIEHLLESLTTLYDPGIIDFATELLTPENWPLSSQLLEVCPCQLPTIRPEPFVNYLQVAENIGEECLAESTRIIISRSRQGEFSGTVGSVCPRYLREKDVSEKLLRELPFSHPARRVYAEILRHAQQEIKRSEEENRQWEELAADE